MLDCEILANGRRHDLILCQSVFPYVGFRRQPTRFRRRSAKDARHLDASRGSSEEVDASIVVGLEFRNQLTYLYAYVAQESVH